MTVIAKPAATTADSHSVRRLRPQSKFLTFMSPAALIPRATPVCSTPPPPQQALDNRRATWLAERRTLGGSAGADRGAKQRHDKLATGVHPVGLRMMLESMWPILPPLARAFQCGARS